MFSLAVAGKGGTGKTTFTALLVKYLMEYRRGSVVLAVDADPNSNLNELLGVKVVETVGSIREKMLKDSVPAEMSKQDYINYRIQNSLVEGEGFDLITMGRPPGQGCYCYANNIIRDTIANLSVRCDYIIVDNEAGMEHLSRKTMPDMDLMFLISDPTQMGVKTAARIRDLTREVNINVRQGIHLVLNKSAPEPDESIRKIINDLGLDLAGIVPEDDLIQKYGLEGKPLLNLPEDSEAFKSAKTIIDGFKI